jgi:hypothetical protein
VLSGVLGYHERLIMKIEYVVELFDSENLERNLRCMSKLEHMLDDKRNPPPPELFTFSDDLPIGGKIKVTLEIVEG